MFKRLAMIGILGVGGVATLAGTGTLSYVRTCLSSASDTVRGKIPVEWEIKRARQMIDELKPEIAQNLKVIAEEEVGVKRLSEEIARKQNQLAKGRTDIMRLKSDLESGSTHFVYAGRKYSDSQVREDLANRFKQFQVHEQTAGKLESVLAAREKNLEAARRKLDEMLSAKRELEVEVENLQARLTMVQVAQTSNPVSIDDSQLSNTRQLIDAIRTRIDVAEQLNVTEGALEGNIPLEQDVSENILEEITSYFQDDQVAEIESLVSIQ